MIVSPRRISVKCENERGYVPCLLKIENGFLSFQKMGAVAGTVGGVVGLIACEHAKRTNEVIWIPLSSITAVEPQMTGIMKWITVRATGFPTYIFSGQKRDMKAIIALLSEVGNNAQEPPRAVSPEPKLRSVELRVTAGARTGEVFRFREGQTMILGRDPSRCNLTLGEYNTISGRHCCLELKETGLTATDLGSTNGTWVNGVRLLPNHPTAVPDGSELWLTSKCTIQVKFD